jgi:Ricin-type beta-trefoil lectin domain-like
MEEPMEGKPKVELVTSTMQSGLARSQSATKKGDMKNIVKRNTFLGFSLFAVIVAGGSLNTVLAQGSEDRTIGQAQRAVRQRIVSQEGNRNLTVLFNTDAQTDSSSRNSVRVRGTGSFSVTAGLRYSNSPNSDPQYRDSRNNSGRPKNFSYEAIVSRNRYGSVSGVRYDLTSDRYGDGRDNNGRDNIGRDNNRGGFGFGNRPNGRVSYSGPIMNRHSDKALDVTERSNQDGANIQQWSYADQPNQNWDVIDLGNGESAIISKQSGRVLTVQGGRNNNGANIIQESWRGGPQQRWRLERISGDYYRIVSVENGKCLDVTREGQQDGANIQLWDYANQANQQWRLRR